MSTKNFSQLVLFNSIFLCLFYANIAFGQTKYEAENAVLTGVTASNDTTASGGKCVADLIDNGDKITFTVSASTAGSYPLVFRYKNGSDKYQDISINGGSAVYTYFPNSGNAWADMNYGNVSLNAGSNTISITKNWGYTSFDYITVTLPSNPTVTYEAESAVLTGVTASNDNTASGGKCVADLIDNGDKITFSVNASTAGSYPLVFRYKNGSDKYQDISINGGAAVYSYFPNSGNAWADMNYGNVSLNAGNNTIAIIKNWGYTAFDYITVTFSSNVAVTGVTVSPATLSLAIGANSTLTATVSPANGTNNAVSWSSSNTSVATVSPSGVVTGVATGNATITVTTQDGGKTATSAVTVTTASSSTLHDPNATQLTKNLWNYLNSVYGKKVITGTWEQSNLDDIYRATGKYTAILGYDMFGWSIPAMSQTDLNNINYAVSCLINHYNAGGIVTVNFHWPNPLDNTKDAWSSISSAQWANIITPGTTEYNQMIASLDWYVNNMLKKLKDSNGNPIPIIFRPLHELSGGWFWWTSTDPSQTAALYRIVHDRIVNYHGMHNLIWVWNTAENMGSASSVSGFYPGDNYCDIVGCDLYHMDYRNTGVHSAWNSLTYRQVTQIFTDLGIPSTKLRALPEGECFPNATKTANDDPAFYKFSYVLAWWAPNDNAGPTDADYQATMPTDIYITRDELPDLKTENAGNSEVADRGGVVNNSDAVSVYPNPLKTTNLKISLDNDFAKEKSLKIKILDISGKEVCNLTCSPGANKQPLQIDRSCFKKGLYIISIIGSNKTKSIKLLVD